MSDATLPYAPMDEELGPEVHNDLWLLFIETLIPIINLAALASGLVIITGAQFAARGWIATLLFLFGPGSGLVLVLDRFDTAVRWALMIGLSIACSILTAQLLLAVHEIHPTPAAIILTSITATGVIARLLKLRTREVKHD